MMSLNFKFDLFNEGIRIGNIVIKPKMIENFISSIIKIIFILVLMFIFIKVGNGIITRFVKRQRKMKYSLDEKKALTIGTILKSLLKYSVYFFGIVSIFEVIFGGVGSVFAGVGGVALGFGAQNLIKDVISGFFILFEEQFSVGDYISIDDKSGVVDKIELRVTRLRDFNGDIHIIPNGLITKVTNHTKGNIRFKVEINIAYEENIDKAISIINSACDRFKIENSDIIVEGPKVYGVTSLGSSGVGVTIYGKTTPMNQWSAEVNLRKNILNKLKEENIEIPYNKLNIIK
ncbi:mechanosensitive ion channel family protein [Clostridium niameyense]|uniref:Mechanosensitive ion channel family protein n=2 Tax=Clostridium niameyense TaxID=1622073 RepID=A0A6M0RCH3_9CLOT|nr:mechanosensitive ion channel family protein [Clostridium niameyense]NEZ47872.1 mechanosensitive ion channel family protein [Clostridium niameyense]